MWSTKLPGHTRHPLGRRLAWPDALRPHLRGRSTVTVRRSADDTVLGTGDVVFGGASRGRRVEVVDAQGRWLAMNKWDRLGPVLEGSDDGVRDRLLANARHIADLMESWGYPIYMVGGSLLGAMRNGGLLPHDDDIDFAFLSEATDDWEAGRVSYELERRLTDAGMTAIVLSLAQIQVTFFTETGETDHYVDIFTGYHTEDGLYNQPFALRGELPRETLVPVSTMTIDGVELPAPARPEAWLEFAYGKGWRIPDPSFVFVSPRSTRRRFDNYFGVFNRQRVYWEKHYEKQPTRPAGPSGGEEQVDRFVSLLPPESFVIDLGCGDGRLTERIANAGHEVLGLDYSYEALRLARQHRPEGVEYRFCNFNNRHMLLELTLELIDQGRQPYFFAHHLLHEMPELGRSDLFQTLFTGLIDKQTFCYATVCTDDPLRDPQNPETWSLRATKLRAEARRFGMGLHTVQSDDQPTSIGDRQTLTTLIWR
ncbi:bifunctional 2-polyprenyl-6-hydroxyphenol methylase/3-demethylubiquinol 3-O-methyltransferase UbiG [Isoptericola sp. b408]|uniref:class I SAM-dependent methyltransferase n=1 Tax=Isoptericola sp. b408 TaxID=3064653 RepID=UPI002713B3D7|nr:methyltransferase domain-containing protein [Isoptericola sp. b408]MDO8152705.1 LicD family protein [Isoptericola sp. b408]